MLTSAQIRQTFLDFFESKQHLVVPSAPMVIKDDPTLMFTNAGMNQFKDYILGNATPKVHRMADAQKCLRVSGKQNDLEEVGHDTYHHTMFEMLGNWSFGDYFKKEAIQWAWELLVEVFHIDANRLYATIFEGNPAENIPLDSEAQELWSNYLPPERILLGSPKDNFWEMGDTGPCGPCSEIHIDLRSEQERHQVPGHLLVNKDHPLVIEIWNLVFMQYNRRADGSLHPLPARHIDTGMGFERLCMVIQGKTSNYDTDLFQTLIESFATRAGIRYGANADKDIALRVVADHLRAIAFSIADGQLPSNNKAGYVVRRILRRAVRYGYSFLGFREPFLALSVPTLVDLMGAHYPELISQQQLIIRVIQEEENAFLRTLESGIHLLDNLVDQAKAKGQTTISGQDAFTLYDTYGFPLDLTELILRERSMTVDLHEFDACMAQQKARSRNAGSIATGDWMVLQDGANTEFIGYDNLEADVHIVRMRTVTSKGKIQYQLVLDRSPFYAESGGQVGDTGTLTSATEIIKVLDVIKENALPIVIVDAFPDNPSALFHAKVDIESRNATACHHTATHLMHYALRHVLGSHVEQKGSLVTPTHLRFDFSHFQRVTDDELRRVEEIVNEFSRAALPASELRNVPIQDAKAMGAMALFGEKYGDKVRVIRFGDSVELCGGTHLSNTGAIGLFRILSEGAISAGVRRIEAIAGRVAEQRDYQLSDTIKAASGLLNAQGDILESISKLQAENTDIRKQLQALRGEQLHHIATRLLERASDRQGITRVVELIPDLSADDLRELSIILRANCPSIAAVLGSVCDGKPALVVALSDSVVAQQKLHAGNIVRQAAKAIAGGGGGQPGFATAGGKNPEGLSEAIRLATQLLEQ